MYQEKQKEGLRIQRMKGSGEMIRLIISYFLGLTPIQNSVKSVNWRNDGT